MMLSAAGVVYAHWTDTLQVDAQVATGNVEMIITSAATDDDGVANAWEIIKETPDQEGTNYDAWPGTSSNDPATYMAGQRYDKDVARCRVTGISPDRHSVQVVVENAYPSYHCTIRSNVKVTGSVPVRNQVARVAACVDSQADCSDPAYFVPVPYDLGSNSFPFDPGGGSDFELVMQDAPGGNCGHQFDPGRTTVWTVGFHVLQDAVQNETYLVEISLDVVNWNEWSLDACDGFARYEDPPGTVRPMPAP